MSSGRYIVGIDLGTTHTALAYAEISDTSIFPCIHTFEIPQTVRPGVVERRPLLPSCAYLPAENELPDGSLSLPWNDRAPRTEKGIQYTVGEFARARGGEVPARLISSAKSWLSQPGSKRRAAVLPWNADPGTPKLSPVEASSLILQHLASAWDDTLGRDPKNGALKDQKIVLCVPASFDAAARDLTLEAARRAGLSDVTLLEEPQAAFYAWIAHARDAWRTLLHVGDLVLVVDIGGGTTDFSLIVVEDESGALALRRISVGEHILLGGDNMDLALARLATARLGAEGITLDAWQMRSLTLACREAKERLLEKPAPTPEPIQPMAIQIPVLQSRLPDAMQSAVPDAAACLYIRRKPKKNHRKVAQLSGGTPALRDAEVLKPRTDVPLPILARGTDVVGKSVNASLECADAKRTILDGFCDECDSTARPCHASRPGLSELGLAYAADPSISKHLAKFLASDQPDLQPSAKTPTAILFNGGVMKSALLRERLSGIVSKWMGSEAVPRVLTGADPELAVARGAAFFGRVQNAQGVRIRGGVPRSYYIGIEAQQPAVPGFAAPVKALCVVPFGMDEGTEFEVPGAEFGLTVGEPAQFRFFSAAERHDDRIGARVEIPQDAIRELEPIETTIPVTLFDAPGTTIPVRLKSVVTAVGTLELWFKASDGAGAWKLEYNVREP